ncbi:thioredoxin reductase (NADPH) [Catalinimonas alkaloidigena]|uniref:Thioredoxin reductase (NADPH) n=1 Tax=Catalinimonas alkaloidigena TaxID=1075417 RepID=A0A1G9P5P7_9BACT|nr:FAD-dependent oxidoreductase [Catalinimonas alkaloidigena]SDL94212.1 thioredoxin reductase (NADPH) [Catalinimonas alkaloidigena]
MAVTDLHPHLRAEHIEQMSAFGHRLGIAQGEYLLRSGEKAHSLFVILEGTVGIFDDTTQERITTHQPTEFTGNMTALSDRRFEYNAVALTDVVVLQVPQLRLKELISQTQELSELLLRTFLVRRVSEVENKYGSIKLFGSRYCPAVFRLKEFFSKNHVQYVWVDLEKDATSERILQEFGVGVEETPVVITNDHKIFKTPSVEEIAAELGLSSLQDASVFDVVVVGAGPAGLAASVYAASEGLQVATIDALGPGGQAGTSSKIENYLGFPLGISGSELASQAYLQAQKFGCHISIPHEVKSLRFEGNVFQLSLASGHTLKSSTVIAATGAAYRKLSFPNLAMYEGRGVYYAATPMELQLVRGKEVIIVGGGNSAGQAAVFLSAHSSKVHLVIRGHDLRNSMSSYLIRRLEHDPNVTLYTHTEVTALAGDGYLAQVELTDRLSQQKTWKDISNLFLFLGAQPCSAWLRSMTCLDEKGFVVTGRDLTQDTLARYQWPLQRLPQSLETCVPGLFAVGDMRSGSVKRVASAVGEGSMAVSQVHAFLTA